MNPAAHPERSHDKIGKNVCRSINFYVVRGSGGGSRGGLLEEPAAASPRSHDAIREHRISDLASLTVRPRRIPTKPLVYRFSEHCGAAGARNLMGAAVAIGLGVFLFTQISSTPNLKLQIAGVAIFCCGLGLYLLPDALRSLFGKLRIDARGVRVTPGLFGFFIPWNELTHWEVDRVTFRFRSPKSRRTFTTSHQVLGVEQRDELREVLRECAAEREQSSAS